MSYSLTFSISLGNSFSGLSLQAQLYDTSGNPSGAPVTTGFAEIGGGTYSWTGTIPHNFQGTVGFSKQGIGAILALADVNPQIDEAAVLSASGLDNIIIEPGVNMRQAITIIASALAGLLSQDNLGNVTIKGINVSTVRIQAVTDPTGDRTAVTLTLP